MATGPQSGGVAPSQVEVVTAVSVVQGTVCVEVSTSVIVVSPPPGVLPGPSVVEQSLTEGAVAQAHTELAPVMTALMEAGGHAVATQPTRT